ncbi:potassium channel family protein [Anaerovorax odorimutans]|uniref:potassium channel family protein n=1 Tax=Anaerovorax odorimutans TaxID=109327 RepID=UPI0004013BB3|nr:potassium channel family protein [Anaerovorax odorimutans]
MNYKIGDISYKNHLGTWRIVGYNVKTPKHGIIEVEFEYSDLLKQKENKKLVREFYYVTNLDIAAKLEANEKIDLSFSYIKDFNISVIQSHCKKEVSFYSFKAEYACFDGETAFDNAKMDDGEISFDYAIFGNGDTSFFNTKFGDSDVSFYNVDFQRGAVSFAEANFGKGNIDFEYTIFGSGNAAFTLAIFGSGNVSFDGAIFETGDVLFLDTNFGEGDVSFEYTNFGQGNIIFDRAAFGCGEVLFDHCIFEKGSVKFLETDFSFSKVIFNKIKFENASLDMTGSIAESVSFQNCNFDNHNKLNFLYVDSLKVLKCIINKTLKITGAKTLSLKGSINLGSIYCNWEEEKVCEAIKNNEDEEKDKKHQFLMLKLNYHKIGEYLEEDKAFVEYMRCRRKELKSKWRISLDKLIDIIGVYGTKPGRVAITMLLIWIFFGIVFTVIGNIDGALTQGFSDHWINGFYFSAVTFVTIGYGDVVPLLAVAKILAPIEGVMGLFLMSYFTVAVVRITLR